MTQIGLGQEESVDQSGKDLPVVAKEKEQDQSGKGLPLVAKDKEQDLCRSGDSLPGLKIFTKVLHKQASDPASPSFKEKQAEKKEELQASSSGSGLKRDQKVLSLESFEAEESKELRKWMKTAGDPGKPRQVKERKQKEKVAKKPAGSMKKTAGGVKGSLSVGMRKSTFRHRASSTAYHKAKKEALRNGVAQEEALAQARKACAKVKDDIDRGILKEEN